MSYTADPPFESPGAIELQLRILSNDKVEFQSPGWQNRDWSSVNNQLHQNNGGIVGELHKIPSP